MNADELHLQVVVATCLYIIFTLVKFVVTDSQPVTMSEVGWLIVKIVIFPCILFVLLDLMYQPDAASSLASKFPKAL